MNFTQHYNLYIPVHGEYPGNWDIPVNQNFNSIDSIIRSLEINNRGLVQPEGKEVGTLWYNEGLDKLSVKKLHGYFNLIDSENFINIIGDVLIKDTSAPAATSNIQLQAYPDQAASETSFWTINATWDPADNAIGYPDNYHDDFSAYILTISRDGDPFAEQKISYTNSFKFTNVKPGYTYLVSIQVVDKQGNKSVSSVVSSIDIYDSVIIPLPPTGISATGTFKGIIVSWNRPLAADITAYEIHASPSVSNFIPDAPVNADASISTSTTLRYSGLSTITTITKNILVNTTYYIKVRTKNKSGNWSSFSSVAMATTLSIETADYANLSIGNAAIDNLAVDNEKISSLDAAKINVGILDADRIGVESITGDKLAFKSITADKIIGGGELVDVAANKDVWVSAGNTVNRGMCGYTAEDSGYWQVFDNQLPATARIDLTGSITMIRELTEISFSSYPSSNTDTIPGKFILEYSTDGSIWQLIQSVETNFKPSAMTDISSFIGSVSARYIRLIIPAGACQSGMGFVLISNFRVKSRQGGTLITGETIQTGSVEAHHITTTSLSAISANLGAITAGTVDLVSGSSWVKSGQSSYNAGKGFWLGIDNGTAKLSLGDAQGAGLHWDGTLLKITGGVLIGTAPDGTGGVLANEVANKSDVAYKVEIISSNGNILRKTNIPTEVLTTLTAIVYQGPLDVTATIPESRFKWTRVSADSAYAWEDNNWNISHNVGYKTINVTSEDVHIRAVFNCEIKEI